MYEYVRRFGFGAPTGVGLPAEDGGRIRPLKVWSKSSIGSVAMGHELTTTTLQLARACSVIANGGLLVKPRLVLERRRPGESAVTEPVETPVRVLAPETAITMRQMMEGVVLAGTGKKARLAGWTSGGKTGSAQIYDHATGRYTHRYNASFMGFAPLSNPAIVVVVTLNGASKYGGTVAAPVFREVASAALRLLDVPKDVPELIPAVDEKEKENDLAIAGLDEDAVPEPVAPQEEVAAGDPNEVVGPRVPDFRGKAKRNVVIMSASLGLPVDMVGSGIARSQVPPAGSVLGRGERIWVEFGR
jgi:cell division protein FtsI (penicillin-binding protein 3)